MAAPMMAGPSTRLDYSNKFILAPMVRIGTLPTRLLALKYGADIVYCEEIIDHKILNAKRIENEVLGTVDYMLSDGTLVFRTHPSEKDRLVFQIGTANAETALKAAKKIENDVAGIDVNMGCPKEFSIKGGMGAALLKKPDKVKEILTTLVNAMSIPVTAKIRLLPDEEESVAFAKMIESTGVAALGVHGRLTEERPRHPNRNHTIRKIVEALTIPVIANGGSKTMKCYQDIVDFRTDTGASSVMVARAAEWNLSVFRREGRLGVKDVVKDYLKIAIDVDNPFPNTKYNILMTMHADMDQHEGLDTQDSKCIEEIGEIWGLADYMKEVREKNRKKKEHIDKHHGIKRRKLDDGSVLIEMPVKYIKKDYDPKVSPKLKLFEWTRRHKIEKANYITEERTEDRCYKSVMEVDGKKFTASYWEKSKQLAEQAAAIVALLVIGEDDGRKPDTDNPNDDVAEVWRRDFAGDYNTEYKHKPVIGDQDKACVDGITDGAENVSSETVKNNGTDATSNADTETERDSITDATNNMNNEIDKSTVESKKVLSAYEIHRHLEPSCTQPSKRNDTGAVDNEDKETDNRINKVSDVKLEDSSGVIDVDICDTNVKEDTKEHIGESNSNQVAVSVTEHTDRRR